MADVSRTVQLDDLSPKELALLVADLTAYDLAQFFNELGWMLEPHIMEAVAGDIDSDAIWLGECLSGAPTQGEA